MNCTIKHIMSTITLAVGILLIFAAGSLQLAMANSSDEPNYIRIGLKYGSSSANTYDVTFNNGVILGVGDNNNFTEKATINDIVLVSISMSGNDISLTGKKNSGESVNLLDGLSGINCIMPANYNSGGTFIFQGNQYRGGVAFNVTSGKITIIDLLHVEDYLYGVINGELSCSYPAEALKAQAVAARSFAIQKLNTHNSYGFDLCNSTHCQVYKGYDDEYAQTTKAVDDTKGKTIKYDGKTVAAFFYKNSGGYTQDIADVWNGQAGYLKAIKDQYSPVYSWSQTYSFDELSSKLSAAGYNVGTLQSVAITKRNQSGAVDTLQFTGASDTVQIQKEKIRTVFGATAIKSTMFSFSNQASTTVPDKNLNVFICPKDSANMKSLPNQVYVLGKDGKIALVDVANLYIQKGSTIAKISNLSNTTTASTDNTKGIENVSSGSVTFYGLGYGHGIGLPQDSAVEMAKQGFTYDEILKYYYTNITID